MVETLKFENITGKQLQICIEPTLAYIDLENRIEIEIQMELINNNYHDEIRLTLNENTLFIYECRQYKMQITIDNELKYETPGDFFI
jgi:hypothetical protein